MRAACARYVRKLLTESVREPPDTDSADMVVLAGVISDRLAHRNDSETFSVLEVGCGKGAVPHMLNRHDFAPRIRYHGIDIDSNTVNLLQATSRRWKRLGEFRATLIDVGALACRGEAYDVVVCECALKSANARKFSRAPRFAPPFKTETVLLGGGAWVMT
mgnify:CR=1 FL=1